jgi:hypothetical protein
MVVEPLLVVIILAFAYAMSRGGSWFPPNGGVLVVRPEGHDEPLDGVAVRTTGEIAISRGTMVTAPGGWQSEAA